MRIGISTLLFVLAMAAPAWALDPSADAAKGTSPQDWLDKTIKDNKKDWDLTGGVPGTDKVFPGVGLSSDMLKILMDVLGATGDHQEKTFCKSAAWGVAWTALSDAAFTGAGINIGKGLGGLMKDIFSLGAGKLATKAGDKAKDAALKKLQDALKKQKPEVYHFRSPRAACTIVLLAIWDKARGTYEIVIYGDCACNDIPAFMTGRLVKLRTFSVRIQGMVNVGIDPKDGLPVVRAGTPTIQTTAVCNVCGPKPAGGGVAPQPEPEPAPVTPKMPPRVIKTCPACQPIADEIAKGYARLDAIDPEIRQAQLVYENAIRNDESAEAVQNAKNKVNQLGVEEIVLKRKLKDLNAQLEECQKTKCKGATDGPGVPPQGGGGQPVPAPGGGQVATPKPKAACDKCKNEEQAASAAIDARDAIEAEVNAAAKKGGAGPALTRKLTAAAEAEESAREALETCNREKCQRGAVDGACPEDKKVGLGSLDPWKLGGGMLAGGWGKVSYDAGNYLAEQSVANPALYRPGLVQADDEGDTSQVTGGILFGLPPTSIDSVGAALYLGYRHQEQDFDQFIPHLRTQANDGLFIPGLGDVFSPFRDGVSIAIPNVELRDIHYRRDVDGDLGILKYIEQCQTECGRSLMPFGGIYYGQTGIDERFRVHVPAAALTAEYRTVFDVENYGFFGGINGQYALGGGFYLNGSAYLSLDRVEADVRDTLFINGTPQWVELNKTNLSIGGGAQAAIGFKISDSANIEAGVAYENHETAPRITRTADPLAPGSSFVEIERQEELVGSVRLNFSF